MRRTLLMVSAIVVACGGGTGGGDDGTGGALGAAGSDATGGVEATGGDATGTGGTEASSGGVAQGGAVTGGADTGGAVTGGTGTGGADTGGVVAATGGLGGIYNCADRACGETCLPPCAYAGGCGAVPPMACNGAGTCQLVAAVDCGNGGADSGGTGAGGVALTGGMGPGGVETGGAPLAGGVETGGADGGGVGNVGGGAGAGGAIPKELACKVNSDCVLRSESCCGNCGAPERGDAIALNRNYVDAYSERVCADPANCILCLVAPPPDNTLLATCSAGSCMVIDLQLHQATECSAPADCALRAPECCECGGSTTEPELIAIAGDQQATYAGLVCDPDSACLACLPTYPDVPVDCVGGHCSVVR